MELIDNPADNPDVIMNFDFCFDLVFAMYSVKFLRIGNV